MTILGCKCLNVLIHIDKVQGEDGGLTRVQLTLDGINVQQHYLVHEIRQGDWTVVNCKVCNCPTHKRINQEFLVYPGLTDYTDSVLEVQNGPDFAAGFNLILPRGISSAKDNPGALSTIASIQSETNKLKKEMKIIYEDKLAQFIKQEKKFLDSNVQKVEEAGQKIRSLVNHYHQTNRVPDTSDHISPPPETRPRKASVSDKKVTFSVSDEVEPAVEPSYYDEEESRSPPSTDDFFQFDMADDDLFTEPGEEDELSGDEHEDEEDDSSSSGCEPDMVMEGVSVPINVPMNYHRESYRSKRISSSVKMDDIAHSMKALMQEFHGGPEEDVPRPRVISRSYNPSKFRHS